tara:strand:+ start:1825 stop:2073 length:249 start_codon:yes stop_codon:yes gene_type:complete
MKKSNTPLEVKVSDRKTGKSDFTKQVDINSNNRLSAAAEESAKDMSARELDHATSRASKDGIDRAFKSGYKSEQLRRGKARK